MAACLTRLLPFRSLWICAVFSAGLASSGFSQTVLFSEDFNGCAFPSSWETNLEGFPGAVWYAGMPQNPKCDGSSIDGSCMLIFDDDASGDLTPPWRLQVATPSFDASGWTTVNLSVDVHFRNYNGSAYFKIFAWNGSEYMQLAKYQGNSGHTGVQFSEYRTFTTDLTFYAGPDTRLMFEYDDGGIWDWWAGIDNLVVTGQGTAQNVLLETFNSCALPAGWSTEIVGGQNDWQFGELVNGNAWASPTMNGTCFAYFDDDGITQAAPPSRVRLISPEIDGSQFSSFYLDFDAIFRRYAAVESFSVGVYDPETGQINWAVDYYTDLGGPQLNSYVHEHLDLSAFRSKKMQLVFQYDDGAVWGWWVGLDNIKLSGDGYINDLCANALDINLGDPCLEANNLTALFDGETPSCVERSVGSLWYRYQAQQDGLVEIRTGADFNEVINVFTGDCSALGDLICTNRDEFGFTGERLFFQAQAGQTYLLRISGRPDAFAPARGNICLQLLPAAGLPPVPINESCEQAIPLTPNGNCTAGNNINAAMNGPQPSRSALARADIWYSFVATPAQPSPTTPSGNFEITTNADFAEVITVYKGSCGNLEEVACNELGESLIVEGLSWGSSYLLQISGAFATVEGGLCVQVKEVPQVAPANDICAQAIPVSIDGSCVSASNIGANFEGPVPSCDVYNSAAVWFSFVAPASGSVQLNTGADFQHTVTVFGGTCDNLEEIYCHRNPIACQGFVPVNNLLPGAMYWVRVSSTANISGIAEQGDLCLRILNTSTPAPFEPLSLDVSVICFSDGTASLNIQAEGGQGAYTFAGTSEQEILNEGEVYLVVVSDEQGCELAVTDEVSCAANNCTLELTTSSVNANCYGSADGQANAELTQSGSYTYVWSTGDTGSSVSGLAAGYYEVTATDANGCAVIGAITIDQPAALVFTLDEVRGSNGNDGAILFTASGGVAPYTTLWSYNGGPLSPIDDMEALAPGSYMAQITDAHGCVIQSEAIVVQQIVAVNEEGLATLLSLLPNPSSGRAVLYLDLPESTELQIAIFDAAGQLLRRFPNQKTQHLTLPIDLTSVPAGIYLIKIQTGDKVLSRRLVISR